MKKELICNKCGGKSFSFKWEYKNEKERNKLLLCHEGFGFQLEDAKIACTKCKKYVNYEGAELRVK